MVEDVVEPGAVLHVLADPDELPTQVAARFSVPWAVADIELAVGWFTGKSTSFRSSHDLNPGDGVRTGGQVECVRVEPDGSELHGGRSRQPPVATATVTAGWSLRRLTKSAAPATSGSWSPRSAKQAATKATNSLLTEA